MRIKLCLCYLFSMAYAISMRNSTFRLEPGSEGRICDPSNQLLSIADQSLLSCCVICKNEPTCEGVCFNKHNQTCVLCNGPVIKSSIKDSNVTYYYLVQEQPAKSTEVDTSQLSVSTEPSGRYVVTDMPGPKLLSPTGLTVEYSSTGAGVPVEPSTTTTELLPSTIATKPLKEIFQDHSYVYFPMAVYWTEAVRSCKNLGTMSFLATADSIEEAHFLEATFSKISGFPIWVWNHTVSKYVDEVQYNTMNCTILFLVIETAIPCNNTSTYVCEKPVTIG